MPHPASARLAALSVLLCMCTGLFLFVPSSAAGSRSIRWQSLNVPTAGRVNALAVHPDNSRILLAGTDTGIYLTRDAGSSWAETAGLPVPEAARRELAASGAGVLALAVIAGDPPVFFAGTARGLFRSSDEGQTWQQAGGDLAAELVTTIAASRLDGKTLFVATTNHLFRSTDGGETWARLFSPAATIWAIAVDPAEPDTLYIGGDGGTLLKSRDGGRTWRAASQGTLAALGAAGVRVQSIAIHPWSGASLVAATTKGIFRSGDGGLTWSLASGPCQGARALAFDSLDPAMVYAGLGGGGVCRSTDGGQSWATVRTSLPHAPVFSLVTAPNGTSIFVATGSGVYRSDEGGSRWVQLNQGLGGEILWLAVPPGKPPLIMAGTRWNVLRTTVDQSEAWTVVKGELANKIVLAAAVDPHDPQRLLLGTTGGEIYRSTGGAHWQRVGELPVNAPVTALAISDRPADGSSPPLYASTALAGVFVSPDGGVGWAALNRGFDSLHVRAMWLIRASPPRLFVATPTGLHRLRKDSVWEQVAGLSASQVNAMAPDPQNPATIYVAAPDRLFKSTDGGERWAELVPRGAESAAFTALAIHPFHSNVLYGAGKGGFWRSADGGQTWLPAGDGLPPGSQVVQIAMNPGEPAVYVGTLQHGIFRGEDGDLLSAPGSGTAILTGSGWLVALLIVLAVGLAGAVTLFSARVRGGAERSERALQTQKAQSTQPKAGEHARYARRAASTLLARIARRAFRSSSAASVPSERGWVPAGRQWSNISRQIERALLDEGQIQPGALQTLPEEYRLAALERYYEEHADQAISLYTEPAGPGPASQRPALRLDASQGLKPQTPDIMRAWHGAVRLAAQTRDAESTGGDLEQSLAHVTAGLCGLLGLTMHESHRHDAREGYVYGYAVHAAAVRLRIPNRFPIVYLPPHVAEALTAAELADVLEALNVTPDFALLVILHDGPASVPGALAVEQRARARAAIANAAVLNGRDLGQVLLARDPERRLFDLVFEQVRLSALSPYTTSGPVAASMFFGRERELKTVTHAVHERSFALVGGRRIGKTSLMARIYHLLSATTGFHPLHLDCGGIRGHKVLMETLNMMWGVEVNGSAPDTLRRFLQATKDMHHQQSVVILLDGVDGLLANDSGQRVSLFRTLRAAAEEGLCQFVFAGGKELDKALRDTSSPLHGLWERVHVGLLSPREARLLVEEPLGELGVELDHAAGVVDGLTSLSAGHPNVLQVLCRQLVEEVDRRESDARRISLADVENLRQSGNFRGHFAEVMWGDCTPLERLLTLLMIEAGGSVTLAGLRQAIARMGIPMDGEDLQGALDTLELYSLLRKDGDTYRFTAASIPLLLRQTEDADAILESLRTVVMREARN